MENTSENEQARGVLRLEKSEEVSNTILENSSEESGGIPTYTTENAELDELLNEASTTKADAEQQEKAEQMHGEPQNTSKMTAEKASKIALAGLSQVIGIASDLTGKEIGMPPLAVKLFTMLTAPVIQKHHQKFEVNTDDVDLDSWKPELMALGGVGVAAVPIYLQITNGEVEETANDNKAGGNHGD